MKFEIGEKCYYCERCFGQECGWMTVDHVIPRCLGGDNDDGNKVICCSECNSSKGGLYLWEWETRLNKKHIVNLIPNPWFRERIPTILKNIKKHPLYESPVSGF